jgi:hypothetical protein
VVGVLHILSIPAQNAALLAKFLSKLHSTSDAPWVCWFRRRYGWSTSRDLGDSHYLDTPIWKAIVAGLASFRLTSHVLLGDGSATAFWHDLWLGNAPLMNASQPYSLTLLDRRPLSPGSSPLTSALTSARAFRMLPMLTFAPLPLN